MASRVVRILKDSQPLLKIVTEAGREVMCTDEHKLLVLDNKTKLPLLISANALTENDYFIINNGDQLDKIATIEYTEDAAYFNSYVYCMEVYDEKHVFNLSNGITVENCRLINDVELLELASQVNSFGAGSSVSLGSHRVLTLNFNRLALEVKSVDKFFKNLDMAVEDTAKILKAHKELVKLLEKKSLQPFMTNGWIRMDRMFSTFGMCGFIECIENLKTYKDYNPNEDLMAKMLKIFNDYVNKYSAKYGIIGNIEEIPAENMAPRLAKIDSLLYKNRIKEPLYANQFVPLWRDSTIWEKMEIEGQYVSKLTGGGISHVQIGEKTTAAQNEKIIKAAIKTGLEHFALNMVNSLCENNHNTMGNINKCPICGNEVMRKFSRVIGFFTEVSNWNSARRDWEFDKRKFIDIAGIDFKNNDKKE
jgi:ribonucleoside-triphosphate reductase